MKKEGFTLIELIISLFILTILFGSGVSLGQLGSNIHYHLTIDSYLYEIQSLLSYGKAVCKENNQYGKFNIDTKTNKITFIEGWDGIEKTIVLPKEIKFQKSINVFVTPQGKIDQGNTIVLIDKNNCRYEIVIRVGVDLIVIKETETY